MATTSSPKSVYSNAFNFTSYQDGKADLRTGQFSAIVNLATLRPQGAATGSRDIKLVFSALSTTNAGYGIGWRLAESQFDLASQVLTLASGESYTANPLPPEGYRLTFLDMKLQNVAVVRTNRTTITIYYLDGTVEVLQQPLPGGPYKTVSLAFENGETFAYSYATTGTLARIFNATLGKEALTVSCRLSALEKVRVLVQGGRIAEVFATSSNQLLTSITVPYDNTSGTADPNAQPRYIYTYKATQQGYQAIAEIRSPMGGTQTISYQDDGLQYYDNSYLPVVVRCETIPGAGQPAVIKRYQFSRDRNFTGYPYNGGFKVGTDNLYNVSGPYEYWGEETTIDPDAGNAIIERVKSTFNKYHLMAREETQRGTSLTTRNYMFNEDPAVGFSKQPANLQVPRQVVTTFKDTVTNASRSEVVTVESDAYGNTLKKTEASGLRYEYEYYPIQGAGVDCPAEPSGFFVRYCRVERIVPSGTGQPRNTQMTYAPLARVQGAGYFVLERTSTNGGMFSTTQYVDDAARPVIHGRPSSTDVQIGASRTSTQFSYLLSGTDLQEDRVITGYDGSVTSASRTFCTITEWLLQARKADEANIVFSYDVLGRVVSQTVAPDTANAATNAYLYKFATTAPAAPAFVEVTDAKGGRYAIRYDGLGRVVSAAQLLAGGAERPIKALVYDRLGNKAQELVFDRLGSQDLKLLSRYAYNGWNELSRTVRPDGSVVLSERDMIANSLTTGVEGLNTTVNLYNGFNKVTEVTQVSASGTRRKTLERGYDGFGRCTSATNVYGHRTEYDYDAFDRISEIRTRPADGTGARTINVSYASFSTAELPTQIAVNDVVLGRRSYDGIGRLISSANGTASPWTYGYDGGAMRPSSSTSPRGVRLKLGYNSALGALTEVASPSDGACRYTHDPVSGQVEDAQNSTGRQHNTYDEYGYKLSEQVTFAGEATDSSYAFSPAGRPLRVTTALGGSLRQSYDAAGRPQGSIGEDFAEEIRYDSFGRVISVRVTIGGITTERTLTFDEFGREATRILRMQGSIWETIHRSYSASGQLSERTTYDGAGALVSRESFTYDAYSRLLSFVCAGTRYPADSQGRRLSAQGFTYDALDNIVRVESTYADGTSNIVTRGFSSSIPTQLVRIEETQSPGVGTLTYDADGNLISDHRGRVYSYNQYGRLVAASSSGIYGYDADGRLVAQIPAGAAPLQFFYAQDALSGQKQGGASVSFHFDGDAVQGRTIHGSGTPRSEVNGLDLSNSVIGRTGEDGRTVGVMYSPYGESGLSIGVVPDDLAAAPAFGFNGVRLDPRANLYFLGNGRRAYSPELMIFLSPDPLAPFGGGGLNAYAYCGCDPINVVDPTGLSGSGLVRSIIGLLVAVIVLVAAVAAAVPTGGASLSGLALLGAVALNAGVVSATAGLIAATLGVASAGISFADEKNGWDRTDTADNLSIASRVFGLVSKAISLGTSVGSGRKAFREPPRSSRTYRVGGYTTGERVTSGIKEGVKSYIGIDPLENKTVFGRNPNPFLNVVAVASFSAGVIGKITGLVTFVQQQNSTDGSIGNGQGESQLPDSASGTDASTDPYQPGFDPISDPIATLGDYAAQFEGLQSLRASMNSQIYYGQS